MTQRIQSSRNRPFLLPSSVSFFLARLRFRYPQVFGPPSRREVTKAAGTKHCHTKQATRFPAFFGGLSQNSRRHDQVRGLEINSRRSFASRPCPLCCGDPHGSPRTHLRRGSQRPEGSPRNGILSSAYSLLRPHGHLAPFILIYFYSIRSE